MKLVCSTSLMFTSFFFAGSLYASSINDLKIQNLTIDPQAEIQEDNAEDDWSDWEGSEDNSGNDSQSDTESEVTENDLKREVARIVNEQDNSQIDESDVELVKTFDEGACRTVHLFQASHKKFIVKVPKGMDDNGETPNEKKMLTELAGCAFIPKIYPVNDSYDFIVTEYIDGVLLAKIDDVIADFGLEEDNLDEEFNLKLKEQPGLGQIEAKTKKYLKKVHGGIYQNHKELVEGSIDEARIEVSLRYAEAIASIWAESYKNENTTLENGKGYLHTDAHWGNYILACDKEKTICIDLGRTSEVDLTTALNDIFNNEKVAWCDGDNGTYDPASIFSGIVYTYLNAVKKVFSRRDDSVSLLHELSQVRLTSHRDLENLLKGLEVTEAELSADAYLVDEEI